MLGLICSVVDDLIAMNFKLITDAHEDTAHWVKLVSSVGLNEIFGDYAARTPGQGKFLPVLEIASECEDRHQMDLADSC